VGFENVFVRFFVCIEKCIEIYRFRPAFIREINFVLAFNLLLSLVSKKKIKEKFESLEPKLYKESPQNEKFLKRTSAFENWRFFWFEWFGNLKGEDMRMKVKFRLV